MVTKAYIAIARANAKGNLASHECAHHRRPLSCDEPTARRLAAYLGETLDAVDRPAPRSKTMTDAGRWRFISAIRLTKAALRDLVKLAAGRRRQTRSASSGSPPSDWVAQSLAGLKPVRAGRFIVHGAHDRADLRANDIGIEIEAALAFGTGHHGTTRGCLLALIN